MTILEIWARADRVKALAERAEKSEVAMYRRKVVENGKRFRDNVPEIDRRWTILRNRHTKLCVIYQSMLGRI